MRRLSLGALILGCGIVLSLPFRRPASPQPSSAESPRKQNAADLLDDDSIEMLVREVTEDVKVPTVFHPHTDYSPPPTSTSRPALPLSYEDLAIPMDRDPFYERRFNAAVAVASPAKPGGQRQRIAELERRFERTPLADSALPPSLGNTPNPLSLPGDPRQWTFREPTRSTEVPNQPKPRGRMGAHLASSDSPPHRPEAAASQTARSGNGRASAGGRSVLSPLPPPSESGEAAAAKHPKQWIRQPE